MTASSIEKTQAQGGSPQEKNTVVPSDAGASPVKAASEKHKEAMNHFVAGKRHLLVKDIEAAVTSLALACELLSAEFGETAYECADAYYYYGKALLEMARAESGVFGNALDGVPEGEDANNSQVEDPDKMTEEERDTVEKEVGEALDENFQALEEKKKNKDKRKNSTEEETEDTEGDEDEEEGEGEEAEKTEKEGEKVEGEASTSTETKDSEPAKPTEETKDKEDTESVGDNAKEGEDKKAQEAEEEEDPSNLQLAWEMLELAKVAYTNKVDALTKEEEKRPIQMKVCETLLTLGEVSLENETYDQAVVDITECLTKRKDLHAADSRRIAETHYQLGVALGHFNKFDDAVKSLEEAITCLKLRMENLKAEKESVDEAKVNDAFYSREAEITELESLIPEIEEKIQDTKDLKKQSSDNQKEEIGFQNGEASGSAKPISTIGVKRKTEAGEVSPTKKVHLENGDAK